MMRRMTVNVGLIIFFVIFSIFLYNAGKGYNLLIDNKAITMDGKDLAPYPWVRVNISTARKPVFLKAGGRDVLFVVGKSHTIHVRSWMKRKMLLRK